MIHEPHTAALAAASHVSCPDDGQRKKGQEIIKVLTVYPESSCHIL